MFIPSYESLCRKSRGRQVFFINPYILIYIFTDGSIAGAQENLMKARDERVSLMNEVSYTFITPWMRNF